MRELLSRVRYEIVDKIAIKHTGGDRQSVHSQATFFTQAKYLGVRPLVPADPSERISMQPQTIKGHLEAEFYSRYDYFGIIKQAQEIIEQTLTFFGYSSTGKQQYETGAYLKFLKFLTQVLEQNCDTESIDYR